MKNKFLVIIFILLITLPNIIFLLPDDASNFENRALHSKPILSIGGLANFPQEFDNYYNDNLPFKDYFVKINSRIKFNLLNMSPYKYVIKGQQGWLFYDSVYKQDGDTISDFLGIQKFTQEENESIKLKLLTMKNICDSVGSEFLIAILPNKETVYGKDYLPNKYTILDNESRTDALIQYLQKDTDLNIVYPKTQLMEEREDYQLYYKLDTHWNNAGAYIGFQQIQYQYMNDSIPPLKHVIKESIDVDEGDLSRMIQIDGLNDTEYKISYKDNIDVDQIDETVLNNMPVLRCISTADTNKKAVVFRDSYCTALIPFISKDFRESLFISSLGFDASIVKKENPDIVIYEMVERQVKNILYAKHDLN